MLVQGPGEVGDSEGNVTQKGLNHLYDSKVPEMCPPFELLPTNI